MATRASIGVYLEPGPAPAQATARPWRGVYHQWDGYPSGLGRVLIDRAADLDGDLDRWIATVIDDAPRGWSNLADGEKCDAPGEPPLSHAAIPGYIDYCYILDTTHRRLDAFAMHAAPGGRHIGSVRFDVSGAADPRFLDLSPEERVAEPPAADQEPVTARSLYASLDAHFPLRVRTPDERVSLFLRDLVEHESGDLAATIRSSHFLSDGTTIGMQTATTVVVPAECRGQSKRVAAFIEAWRQTIVERLAHGDGLGNSEIRLFSPNALARSGAQTVDGFLKVLRCARYQ